MNIAFFIGNGFDVNCGMRTKYTDMYEEYAQEKPEDSDVIIKFKQAIKKEKYETWADFEMGMCKYASELNSEDDLITCVSDFKIFLHSQLDYEESSFNSKAFNPNISQVMLKEMSNSIREFYKYLIPKDRDNIEALMQAGRIQYDFVSLNYTNTLNKFVTEIKSLQQNTSLISSQHRSVTINNVVNIHGNLSDDLIMGIDNINQFGTLRFELGEDGLNAFVKPVSNSNYNPSRVNKAKFIINTSDIICVYGASLGDSDLLWRNTILTWLTSKPERHLVYFEHLYAKISRTDNYLIMKTERELKSKLLKRFNVDEALFDQLKRQIHIPVTGSIFNVETLLANEKNASLVSTGSSV